MARSSDPMRRCATWIALALLCAVPVTASVTVYNNFGPEHEGFDYNWGLGWTIAGDDLPDPKGQFGVEQAFLFTPSASGSLADIWLPIWHVPFSSGADEVTVRIAENTNDTHPLPEDVLEEWTLTEFPTWTDWAEPHHLISDEMPQLVAGESYWIWAEGGATTWTGWAMNLDPALTLPHTLRRENEDWLNVSDETASALRVDVSELAFTPTALIVDPSELDSDGNGVFEPQELVEVMPTWRNDGEVGVSLTGTVSQFDGPEGANYSVGAADAVYGLVEPAAMASCEDTGTCYSLGVNDPAVRPARHWDAAFEETLSDGTGEIWSLHIGDSFTDVPRASLFYSAIEILLHHGVTGGCAGTGYCPAGINSRGQMAVFLLKAAEGSDYVPLACVADGERFADVPANSPLCPWIEELADREITTGCGGGDYCPGDPVTRAQMAVFLLRAFEGNGYSPPACEGEFSDVECSSAFAAWIEELAARGVTGGCSADPPAYCPAIPVTRAQMAVFVTETFGLALYGP